MIAAKEKGFCSERNTWRYGCGLYLFTLSYEGQPAANMVRLAGSFEPFQIELYCSGLDVIMNVR